MNPDKKLNDPINQARLVGLMEGDGICCYNQGRLKLGYCGTDLHSVSQFTDLFGPLVALHKEPQKNSENYCYIAQVNEKHLQFAVAKILLNAGLRNQKRSQALQAFMEDYRETYQTAPHGQTRRQKTAQDLQMLGYNKTEVARLLELKSREMPTNPNVTQELQSEQVAKLANRKHHFTPEELAVIFP